MDKELKSKDSDFLDMVLDADRPGCSQYVSQIMEQKKNVTEIYESLFKPTLYEVGTLWEHNQISVSDEHLATSVIESLMNELYPKIISDKRTSKKVVVACTENELHQIGAKMVADIFELNGWDTFFLGSNVPTNELIKFIERVKPDLVALSVSIYFNIPVLEKMIVNILNVFPNLEIIVGGQAFKHGGHNVLQKYNRVHYLPDLKSVDDFIKKYRNHE